MIVVFFFVSKLVSTYSTWKLTFMKIVIISVFFRSFKPYITAAPCMAPNIAPTAVIDNANHITCRYCFCCYTAARFWDRHCFACTVEWKNTITGTRYTKLSRSIAYKILFTISIIDSNRRCTVPCKVNVI